jgi:uncharacterized protein YqeY
MSLIAQIKADQLAARKARDADTAALLTTVLGEADTKAKKDGLSEFPDDKTIALVKSFIANQRELITKVEATASIAVAANREIEVLSKYLPVQLTEAQLEDAVKAVIARSPETPKIGVIMGALKQQLTPGTYDGALLSAVIKRLIS